MSTKTPPETITVEGIAYNVADLQDALRRARETMQRGGHNVADAIQRGVDAYRRDVAARADRAACAAAQRDAAAEGMQLDPDEALVWEHALDAVALAGPDEARVLVRASMLLSYGLDAGEVARALSRWGERYPELIGTAPDVSWSDAIAHARAQQAVCGVQLQVLFDNGRQVALSECIRARGHDGAHDAGPF